ncbi:MAG: hypothetical protein JJU33_13350 [Phycisphaerales bacterium]|nr:hypothetical protein [Phycisphaerales bacterium]
MLITRRIGKLIRGRATPLQIVLATTLGAMIGFVPGFSQAPGLLIALVLLLVVLNANLFLAIVSAGVFKLVALALLPVSFHAGRVLLDGPTRPLFEWAINAPVLAFFGFEFYANTGGQLIAIVLGVASGLLLVKMLSDYRKRMSKLEQGSDRYKKLAANPFARFSTWLLLGKSKGKKTYEDLLKKKVGLPIRPVGVGLVLVLLVVGFFARGLLAEPILTRTAKHAMERANGATVDIESVSLNIREGRVTVARLAMADAAELDKDLFRADTLEALVDTADLLRGRFAVDRVTVREAFSGPQRETPGVLIGREPRPDPDPGPGKTIEDYVKDAELWYDRLRQIERWLEKIGEKTDDEPTDPVGDEDQETLRERLERRAAELGYARVRADHLMQDAPKFIVREIEIDGLIIEAMPDEPVRLVARSLSTHPHLVAEAPSIDFRSINETLVFNASLREASRGGGANTLTFVRKGLSADQISSMLLPQDWTGGSPLLEGGTLDVSLDGGFGLAGGIRLDMPLNIDFHNTKLQLPQVGATDLDKMSLPLLVTGRISAPRISVEDDALVRALRQAGEQRAAELIGEQADRVTDEAERRIRDAVGEETTDRLRGLLPGQRRERDRNDSGGGG